MSKIGTKTTSISILLIIIMGLAIYANSIKGSFIWDDDNLIKYNRYIKNPGLADILTKEIGAGSGGTLYHFYRPVQILTYKLDYFFWKLDTRGYHITNILLHIAAALSVYWLILLLYNNTILSFLTGAFFVTHPVHVEAVSWISGRPEILSLLFTALAFIFYIKSSRARKGPFFILMLVTYTIALLSKENSLILPLLLLIYHYIFKVKIEYEKFLNIIFLALIYVTLSAAVVGSPLFGNSDLIAMTKRMPSFFVAIPKYLALLMLPFSLHADYGPGIFGFADMRVLGGMALTFVLLILGFVKRRERPRLSFSILWFLAALLPVSNIRPLFSYMAERYLYLPSIGFFFILANGFGRMYELKRYRAVSLSLAALLLVFYSYLTIKQNNYWKEPIAFYERTLKYSPDNAAVIDNLGILYSEAGRKEDAVRSYKRAIWLNPDYERAYNDLGNIYNDAGDYDEAIKLYNKAILLKPDYAEAHYNLGNAYKNMHRYDEAVKSYKKAIHLRPDHERAHNNLGGVYADAGEYDEAILSYKRAIEFDPSNAIVYKNLAVAYYCEKQYDAAIQCYNRAIDLGYKGDPEFLKLLEGVYAR